MKDCISSVTHNPPCLTLAVKNKETIELSLFKYLIETPGYNLKKRELYSFKLSDIDGRSKRTINRKQFQYFFHQKRMYGQNTP